MKESRNGDLPCSNHAFDTLGTKESMYHTFMKILMTGTQTVRRGVSAVACALRTHLTG